MLAVIEARPRQGSLVLDELLGGGEARRVATVVLDLDPHVVWSAAVARRSTPDIAQAIYARLPHEEQGAWAWLSAFTRGGAAPQDVRPQRVGPGELLVPGLLHAERLWRRVPEAMTRQGLKSPRGLLRPPVTDDPAGSVVLWCGAGLTPWSALVASHADDVLVVIYAEDRDLTHHEAVCASGWLNEAVGTHVNAGIFVSMRQPAQSTHNLALAEHVGKPLFWLGDGAPSLKRLREALPPQLKLWQMVEQANGEVGLRKVWHPRVGLRQTTTVHPPHT